MLQSMLKVHLLLVILLTVCIIPAAVSAVTEDFGPRNETNWTGYIKHASGYEKFDGSILVGFVGNWPTPDDTYRGWVTFDITNLPSNACVTVIELHGNCFVPGGDFHTVTAKAMSAYPPTETAQTIYDAIGAGDWYNTCDACMRSMGAQSMYLTRSANDDLESAAQGSGLKYFAVGLMELGENVSPGFWHGRGSEAPILRVTYTVPPAIAPTLIVSDDTVCVGEEFCIGWNPVPGATNYGVVGGWGGWTNSEWCGTTANTGTYLFSVYGVNSCGNGPSSATISVTVIDKPEVPANVFVPGSKCTNSSYTVSWTPVTGVSGYQIREDNGAWINTGNTTQWTFIHLSAGMHNYSVRAVNMCGTGSFNTSPDFYVLETLVAPAAPTASNSTPCPNENITISWPSVTNATKYQLTESRFGIVYIGPLTSWNHTPTSGSYEYQLAVTNGCGWSNFSTPPLSVRVKQPLAAPGAPVSDPDPAVVDETYTISWNAVLGATSYRIFERLTSGGSTYLIYNGSDLEMQIVKSQAGVFTYTLKACDDCGCSAGVELVLIVDEPTDVVEIDAPELPDSYSLGQNYPNPFNPETRIEFSLKRAGRVKLTVYDILGKTVRSLVNEQLSAGYKAVVWDGRDNSGRSVTSGVYLYQLTAGDFSASRKMLLVK